VSDISVLDDFGRLGCEAGAAEAGRGGKDK
jgi:hypothetical protein